MENNSQELPDDLRRCIDFHGHFCPGLTYGYLVAVEAVRRLNTDRSEDEELVVITENDSCAVDALQVILGTTAGKGNLIFKNYGKNVFTVFSRKTGRALRFARKTAYRYRSRDEVDFELLGRKIATQTATTEESARYRRMKALDLLNQDFASVYVTQEIPLPEQAYARLAPSAACSSCGEMTMATRLVQTDYQDRYCIPCAEKKGIQVRYSAES